MIVYITVEIDDVAGVDAFIAQNAVFCDFHASAEHDRLVAVRQHAVFEVVAQAAREYGFFDVFAVTHHGFDRVGVVDADHVLLDDRPLVELAGDVVAGRADQFDAALVRLMVGFGADEAGQEGVVDVENAARIFGA